MSEIAQCPFCNLSNRILKENQYAIAFLSNPRKTPGHFLVSPKRHVEKPWELTSEELSAIFKIIFFIEKKLIEKCDGGADIRQHYRPFMKQGRLKVDHIHFHILPRSNEDRIYQISEKHDTKLFENLDEKEVNEIVALLD